MMTTIKMMFPVAACLAAIALSGCSTSSASSVEVPVPVRPTVTAEIVGPRALPPRTSVGSNKTGFYPGFAEAPKTAGAQMSVAEADKMQANLTAVSTARSSGKMTEAEYRRRLAELRDLAENHGTNAQANIAK